MLEFKLSQARLVFDQMKNTVQVLFLQQVVLMELQDLENQLIEENPLIREETVEKHVHLV